MSPFWKSPVNFPSCFFSDFTYIYAIIILSFFPHPQAVGFTHVHRAMAAHKPNCQFDTVINGAYNFSARFEGEACMVEQMTGGAAAGDYDNDGYVDIFFTVYHGPSLLYRNNGNHVYPFDGQV